MALTALHCMVAKFLQTNKHALKLTSYYKRIFQKNVSHDLVFNIVTQLLVIILLAISKYIL